MKKLITVLLTAILFIANSTYADCNKKEVDANSKFDAAMTLLDAMEVVESNEVETTNANKNLTPDNMVKLLIAYKQENIDFNCQIEQLDKFTNTRKTNIRVSLGKVNDYLKKRIEWNMEVLNALNSDNFKNLNTFQNDIADLAIKNKTLNKLYSEAMMNLLLVIQFEKSDDAKVNIEAVNGKYFNKLWITDDERKKLLKKISTINTDKFSTEALLALHFAVNGQLAYTNKDVETMEKIKKKYEH